MKIILELSINNNSAIFIASKYNRKIDNIYPYSGELFVLFKYKGGTLKIAPWITLFDLREILEHCELVLQRKNLIAPEIGTYNNISKSFHEYWNYVSLHPKEKSANWAGASLKLFESGSIGLQSNITFLYNNNNNIELQITSKYPWFFPLKKAPMLYTTWLKHYKILYHHVILDDVMKNWIILLQKLIEQFDNNIERMTISK